MLRGRCGPEAVNRRALGFCGAHLDYELMVLQRSRTGGASRFEA